MPSDATPGTDDPAPALVTLGDTTGEKSESTLTVLIAFTANLLVAIAKTFAAALTGSASLVAEAAHSWADTGNEIFLMIANRMSRRKADVDHPLGYGREAYVWALFAALGLFVAGSAVSITNGLHELFDPEPATDFVIGYLVLGLSFLLEGTSFLQSVRQARREATTTHRDTIDHVLATSDPTLGLGLHQATGSAVPDALGSILVGVLLGVVAVVLIDRNRRFLVGMQVSPTVRAAIIQALRDLPEVSRVTALRVDFIGPRQLYLVADVDLSGDDPESTLALRLRALEARIRQSPAVVDCTLSLSAPDEPDL
jgi:cation diffusion facilitator family transporter